MSEIDSSSSVESSSFEVSESSSSEVNTGSFETGSSTGSSFSEAESGYETLWSETGTLEEAQQVVEGFHQDSIEQILDTYGQYFNEADRARVEGRASVQAVEYQPYSGWAGRYASGSQSIEVAAISKEQMERTTKHETNHFASKNQEIIVPDPERKGYTVYQNVGMRQTSWFHNVETGQNSDIQTRGRGLNEGVTTMFTTEQLYDISYEKGLAAERQEIYGPAVDACSQLQEIVGKDSLASAYYGGKTGELQSRVDELGGEGTYRNFEESLDKTLSSDYAQRVEGMKDAQTILSRLYEAKERRTYA